MKTYQHWHCETDQSDILWLGFDRQDKTMNALNREALEELDGILTDIEKEKNIRALIIYSRKATGFCAGADIEQFTKVASLDEAKKLIRQGQRVFTKLQHLPIRTVAMIQGPCLGGGLELALACDIRVADDDTKTKLGLPEVKLGIHPGWGGTIRLTKLIGPIKALPIMLEGKLMPAKPFKKLGVVDAAVPERHLKRAATFLALEGAKKRKLSTLDKIASSKLIRPLMGRYMSVKVGEKVRQEHYPAPFALIDHWVEYGAEGEAAMLAEADSVSRLLMTDQAQNLVRVFFLQEKLKSLGKGSQFKAKHVHVIGAGVMGGDIAAWCALSGCNVTLQDTEPKAIAATIKRAYKLFSKKRRGVVHRVQAAMDRLIPDPQGKGISQADVIIEAIVEDLEAKQSVFQKVQQLAKPSAILATNTSSIPLDEINQCLPAADRKRLVGIHFFNPVSLMQLVEVVSGEQTAQTVVADAMAFVRQIDKLPVPVKSSPGFLVNRILMGYLMEAMTLVEEGVPIQVIDEAALAFGMPMGPIELIDTIGMDVCLSVARTLVKHLKGDIPPVLVQKVESGDIGRKSGKGFYHYKNGRPVHTQSQSPNSHTADYPDIADRLIQRMVTESAACLREGVVESPDLLDAAMVFGTGFAPFRGGVCQYVRSLGKEELDSKVNKLTQRYGERFELTSQEIGS